MIIIDAHAHIYPCFNLDDFIFSAFNNLFCDNVASAQPPGSAVIFLTETADSNYFSVLKNEKNRTDSSTQPKTWHVVDTGERPSLRIKHSNFPEKELIVVSGQQVVTLEKLEVLSIGCQYPQPEGAALRNTVHSIFSGNGLAILPWGVGKWLGKRGRIIDTFVAAETTPRLFLGDNGSRPRFWKVSRLEQCPKTKRFRLLSGTDPLPLPGEEKRVGSFGSIIQGTLNPEKPFESLKDLLCHPETEINGHGNLQPPLSFIKQQAALRMAR